MPGADHVTTPTGILETDRAKIGALLSRACITLTLIGRHCNNSVAEEHINTMARQLSLIVDVIDPPEGR